MPNPVDELDPSTAILSIPFEVMHYLSMRSHSAAKDSGPRSGRDHRLDGTQPNLPIVTFATRRNTTGHCARPYRHVRGPSVRSRSTAGP